ncbi:hypothetical protein FK85_10265 [Halorubrum saccharovorum]|uniref:Uncharacterized protein n=1 Tax=Halorubrum saccharovorum TaxID=2248 RepID=A0A081ETN9_9EURY|nr:hypothetical protein [Halorubrum saccharovorum]KDS90777.2 hypothetical protein FK85_10265 [Halorubrum saccharovorum]
MTRPLSRRRVLAAAVPGLLAGCLVESSEEGAEGPSESADAGPSAESGSADDGAPESLDAGETADQADGNGTTDQLGPDGSGLVVTEAEVVDVTNEGAQTRVEAEITVENAGRFTYGTVELRVDAYATGLRDRKPVGYDYALESFSAGNRFDDGMRRFEATIYVPNSETHTRPDPDWYDIDAAVRRAEPA